MIEFKQVRFEFQIQTLIRYIIIQTMNNLLNNYITWKIKNIKEYEHILKAH